MAAAPRSSPREIIARCDPEVRAATKQSAPLYGPPDLRGRQFAAKAYQVYDGDTCRCAFRMPDGALRTFKVRILGHDTPEIRGKSKGEKKLAIIARDRARELIDEQVVALSCDEGYDQYQRLLAKVELADGRDLAEVLIAEHLAYPYDGGKKNRDWRPLAELRDDFEIEDGDFPDEAD